MPLIYIKPTYPLVFHIYLIILLLLTPPLTLSYHKLNKTFSFNILSLTLLHSSSVSQHSFANSN
ncbi:Protein kinase, core [Nosema bombycis CQ1]|uniref:Protein kinase, core n=1 Tax=Nosema bombycis (strain CQ1 / CVCC 102059) TaxID=578461 RepID=R0M9S2_NOSB1|nr:Protein kinase, core [Nosema bombycis CQ1]|eukprot:EOB14729.1 Protein kinase, core [Nosema bombycis CQ1]